MATKGIWSSTRHSTACFSRLRPASNRPVAVMQLDNSTHMDYWGALRAVPSPGRDPASPPAIMTGALAGQPVLCQTRSRALTWRFALGRRHHTGRQPRPAPTRMLPTAHNWRICCGRQDQSIGSARVQSRHTRDLSGRVHSLCVTVRYSQHGTGSGWTAGGLMGTRGSSPVTPGRPTGPETGADAMVKRACCEQHKATQARAIYEDQHAGSTNKTSFRGTRRHTAARPLE
jgi:hypothetical protein